MSIPKWLQIGHDQVFSFGAFVVSEVTPMIDFDKSSGENRVQARDRDTGCTDVAGRSTRRDPTAPKRSRTVTVKFAAHNATHCTHQFQRNTFHPSGFRGTDGAAVHREVGRFLADRVVVPSLGHDSARQAVRGVELRSGVGMNPDPFAPVDPDTPLRFDHLLHLLTNLPCAWRSSWSSPAPPSIYWRLHSPETYEERFATPARLLRWRLWAHVSWQRLCKRCGLSAAEQVTRRDNEGRQVSSTRWFHPKLLGTDVSRTSLHLTVRARMGQTVEDLERAVPAIRDAAGAHSARSVSSPLGRFGSNWSCGNSCRR